MRDNLRLKKELKNAKIREGLFSLNASRDEQKTIRGAFPPRELDRLIELAKELIQWNPASCKANHFYFSKQLVSYINQPTLLPVTNYIDYESDLEQEPST